MKSKVFITLSLIVIASMLITACGAPAVPASDSPQPAAIPTETLTPKSEVVLDLTGIDLRDWPVAVQNVFATRDQDAKVLVVEVTDAEAASIVVPAAFNTFAPTLIGRVILGTGMSVLFYELTVTNEQEQAIRDAILLYHNYMWISIHQWREVQLTAAEIQAVAAALGIFRKTIEWTDPSDSSKHVLEIVSSFGPWSCEITYTTTQTWMDEDGPHTESIKEVFEKPNWYCLPDDIIVPMAKVALRISAITTIGQAAREKLDRWAQGIGITLEPVYFKLFMFVHKLPLDPELWTPK